MWEITEDDVQKALHELGAANLQALADKIRGMKGIPEDQIKRVRRNVYSILEELEKRKKVEQFRDTVKVTREKKTEYKKKGWLWRLKEAVKPSPPNWTHYDNIVLSLKKLVGDALDPTKLETASAHEEYALKHLCTGYSEVYQTYGEIQEITAKIQGQRMKFDRVLKENIKARLNLEPGAADDLARCIYNDIEADLKHIDKSPYYQQHVSTDGRATMVGSYRLAEGDITAQLKEFMQEQDASIHNRKMCAKLIELEKIRSDLESKLRQNLRLIILKVENRNPLLGNCDLCPSPTRLPNGAS